MLCHRLTPFKISVSKIKNPKLPHITHWTLQSRPFFLCQTQDVTSMILLAARWKIFTVLNIWDRHHKPQFCDLKRLRWIQSSKCLNLKDCHWKYGNPTKMLLGCQQNQCTKERSFLCRLKQVFKISAQQVFVRLWVAGGDFNTQSQWCISIN